MDSVRVCPAQAMNMAKASANTTAVVSVLLNIVIVFRLIILGVIRLPYPLWGDRIASVIH